MAACYAPDVQFSDPVFPDLRGREAGAMWQMLTEAPGDLRIELLEHDADEASGIRPLARPLRVQPDRPPGDQRRPGHASTSGTA